VKAFIWYLLFFSVHTKPKAAAKKAKRVMRIIKGTLA
jgi:hypothetical protein